MDKAAKWIFLIALGLAAFFLGAIAGLLVIASLPITTIREALAYLVLVGTVLAFVLAAGLAVAGFTYFLVWLSSIGTECPKCRRWWAKQWAGRKVLEVRRCYGLVTRRAYTNTTTWGGGTSYYGHRQAYHSGSSHGFGTTSWQERVPVIRTTYRDSYRCKFCGTEWREDRVEKREDFDR